MINIKRPKSKTQHFAEKASEHLFEIAAGLFVVMIVGLSVYIVGKANTRPDTNGTVAGVQTTREEESTNDLVNVIAKGSNYKYFFDALTRTGLYQRLTSNDKYTVLVPDDNAFKKLGEEELTALFSDSNRLKTVIENHIINGELKRLDISRVEWMRSVNGKYITVNINDFGTIFNTAKLMSGGSSADNGIAYEIDNLIL